MNFLKNYLSTLLFILFAYVIYTHSQFHINFMSGSLSFNFFEWSIPQLQIFYWIVVLYIIMLIPYYIIYPLKSKARIVIWYFMKVASGNRSYSEIEKTALLAWIVKLFFVPLMITWLSGHIFSMTNNLYGAYGNIALFSTDFLVFFNEYFFWTAFSLILFSDVLFFTLWYLLEAPFLKNTIRSVEPTIIGWAVCIFCYPPFNSHVTNLVGWYSTDFPSFAHPYVHVAMNIIILLLMGIYAWASLSLWLKASNLTNRGIVIVGPYKYIRHPAYICKNSAWFIGGIPMVYLALQSNNFLYFISVLFGLFSWAFIYYLRAMTEENHLSADPDYIEYKKLVPYKFIPKIW